MRTSNKRNENALIAMSMICNGMFMAFKNFIQKNNINLTHTDENEMSIFNHIFNLDPTNHNLFQLCNLSDDNDYEKHNNILAIYIKHLYFTFKCNMVDCLLTAIKTSRKTPQVEYAKKIFMYYFIKNRNDIKEQQMYIP